MTDQIEDLIMTEARRQGYQPDQNAMIAAAIHLAGSAMVNGLIVIPNKGAISAGDIVRGLRNQMPEAFTGLDKEGAEETTSTSLTEQMRREVAATRRRRALPSDWLAVRSKAKGITAEHLAERERTW